VEPSSAREARRREAGEEAMQRVSERCADLVAAQRTRAAASARDAHAQAEIAELARALAASPEPCGYGTPTPPGVEKRWRGCLLEPTELDWSGEGWSCVARALGREREGEEPPRLTASYVYSFRTDAKLRTYEIHGRGCHVLFGETTGTLETDLVVKGRLGESVATPLVYRVPPHQPRRPREELDSPR
jgi:hypothetical protein